MKINTDRWYFINPYNCKFTSKTEGYTACGKKLQVQNKKVCLVETIYEWDNDNYLITLKPIN